MRWATTTRAALHPWTGSARAVWSGRSLAQAPTNAGVERPSSASRRLAGAVTSSPLSWLMAAVRALTARCARHPSQHGPGGGLGVDRIGLTPLASGPPVGPVDLHHGHALVQEHPGEPGAVAAGAFHPDRPELAVPAKPAQQLPVATAGSRELAVAEQPSLLVDDGSVVGATVGVDPADDNTGALGHPGVAFPLDDRAGQARTGRAGGHTSDGA